MKEKCQVFTPKNYVSELLDSVNYKKNIIGKKVLENSCGDGNILKGIVLRYIEDGKRNFFSDIEIAKGLSRDIYGIEIDKEQYEKCILDLNQLLEYNSIPFVHWNIYNTDYLRWDNDEEFDFIIGNPPYVTYKELSIAERKFLKEKFASCKHGKFDYCYAFIEKSFLSLSSSGKMSYLIPNSIFKTVFGEKLRNIILPGLVEIKDYTSFQIFKDVLVKSAIIILNSKNNKKNIIYKDYSNNYKLKINSCDLGNKWIFASKKSKKKRFGDYYRVSHVIATLYNDAFVLKKWKRKDNEIICDDISIEKEILRVAATPRENKKKEYIIFPYFYENGILKHYSVENFEYLFPGATAHLNKFREKLDKRMKDKNTNWFEFGRSQALNHINSKKLLLSTVVTNSIKIFKLNSNCIPYSGMFITALGNNSLETAKQILETDDFLEYAKNVGIHISGTSVRITSKDIMNYTFGE